MLASSTHIISMYRNKYSIQLAVGLAPDYSGVLPGAVLGATVASAGDQADRRTVAVEGPAARRAVVVERRVDSGLGMFTS